jgi:hypothetical protein
VTSKSTREIRWFRFDRRRAVSGRGNDWVKKSCAQRETLTIRRIRAQRSSL